MLTTTCIVPNKNLRGGPAFFSKPYAAGLALFFSLLLCFSVSLTAQVPAKPDPPHLVSDLGGMLQPDEVNALEQKLLAYEDSTSNQIAIVTVPTLGGFDVAQFADELFEKWGIGQKGKNNGLLILLARDEHKTHISTGYGLEGPVPDALAKRILQEVMKPLFKKGQFYQGLSDGVNYLEKAAAGEYKAPPKAKTVKKSIGLFKGILMLIFIIIALVAISKNPWLLLLFLNNGNRGGRGGGSWGDFSGGGGSFGGFGGGSSGGGGASGDW